MTTLSNALLSREPTPEYRQAVTRALDIPDCQVSVWMHAYVCLPAMTTLSNALLSREPTPEYRQAVTRALDIPDCQVLPLTFHLTLTCELFTILRTNSRIQAGCYQGALYFLFWWFTENTHKICLSGKCLCGSHWHTLVSIFPVTLCTTTMVYGGLVHHQAAICTTKAQCAPWGTRETTFF